MEDRRVEVAVVVGRLDGLVSDVVGGAVDMTGFDAAAGNPCGAAGTGAIPETTDAAAKAKLQATADAAKAGLASTDLAAAQKAAQATADAL